MTKSVAERMHFCHIGQYHFERRFFILLFSEWNGQTFQTLKSNLDSSYTDTKFTMAANSNSFWIPTEIFQ